MITRVCGLNTGGVIKVPERKVRNLQFGISSNIPYNSNYSKEYEKQQQNNAARTGVYLVLGSVLFIAACFLFSETKNIKK